MLLKCYGIPRGSLWTTQGANFVPMSTLTTPNIGSTNVIHNIRGSFACSFYSWYMLAMSLHILCRTNCLVSIYKRINRYKFESRNGNIQKPVGQYFSLQEHSVRMAIPRAKECQETDNVLEGSMLLLLLFLLLKNHTRCQDACLINNCFSHSLKWPLLIM